MTGKANPTMRLECKPCWTVVGLFIIARATAIGPELSGQHDDGVVGHERGRVAPCGEGAAGGGCRRTAGQLQCLGEGCMVAKLTQCGSRVRWCLRVDESKAASMAAI